MNLRRSLLRLKWLLRYGGLSTIALTLLALVCPPFRKSPWYVSRKETAFDRRFQVSTGGDLLVSEMDLDSDAIQGAEDYMVSSGASFGIVLDELDIDFRQFTFLDIGCGKGRPLFMAAEFPFSQIIGVEHSRSLTEIANANIASFTNDKRRCKDIQCLQADATTFDFPITPLVVYLFNPFHAEILSQMLERLETSWSTQPRDIFILYYNPVQRSVLDTSDFWQEHPLKHGPAPEGWAVYRNSVTANSSSPRSPDCGTPLSGESGYPKSTTPAAVTRPRP